jgi:hypothetical protein
MDDHFLMRCNLKARMPNIRKALTSPHLRRARSVMLGDKLNDSLGAANERPRVAGAAAHGPTHLPQPSKCPDVA